MRRPSELRIVVHVAGAPTKVFPGPNTDASATQRCVACGFLLIDNTAWLAGRAEVVLELAAEGGGTIPARTVDGPSWYPAGALIGTDKTSETAGGMTYVKPDGAALDDNETACT
jgi:hypothetical protein